MNPEFRQTLNTLSRNIESANEAAQENIYTFTQLYIDPCLSGLKISVRDCTSPCFPNRDAHLRRQRGRPRGRPDLNFNFYDDWDEDDDVANSLIGWRNDELDGLLADSGSRNGQPGRRRAMSYGSRQRRRATTLPTDQEQDPTVIRGSSYLGFLERLPFNLGSRMLRYKPSAANLQTNPGGVRLRDEDEEAISTQGTDDMRPLKKKGHGRQRSDTQTSHSTMTSISSRGDLILSEEEEDAIPIDDEFAVMLTKRITNTGSEDHSSGRGSSKRPTPSRTSTRTFSSKSLSSLGKGKRSGSRKSSEPVSPIGAETIEPLTIEALQQEEDEARREQEMEVEQKREAAQRLAEDIGLVLSEHTSEVSRSPCCLVRPADLQPAATWT